MGTFHEWLAERTKNEGLWLNAKNAVIGMSNINPLLQKKAKVKPLKLPKTKLSYCQELCLEVLDQAAFCSTPSVKTFPSRTRTIW